MKKNLQWSCKGVHSKESCFNFSYSRRENRMCWCRWLSTGLVANMWPYKCTTKSSTFGWCQKLPQIPLIHNWESPWWQGVALSFLWGRWSSILEPQKHAWGHPFVIQHDALQFVIFVTCVNISCSRRIQDLCKQTCNSLRDFNSIFNVAFASTHYPFP